MIWGCLGGNLLLRTTQNSASEILGESVVIQPTAQFAGVVQIASAALQRHYSSLLFYFSHLSKNFLFD